MLKKRIFIQHVRDINDIDTAYEIFGNENYGITKLAHWDQIKKKIVNKIPLIINCGSNIGSSSHFFCELFEKSKIICIEPEINNFNQLKKIFKSNQAEYFCNAASCEKKNYSLIHSENNRAFIINFEKN